MLGFNGGLMGVRKVPTANSASGLWFQNEQSVAKRAEIWPVGQNDEYWNNVSLLLHMDGSNGSTTFTDSSSNARTVTAGGDAQISTAQSKFGGSSGLFDGTGDLLNVTVGAIGTGSYTIEGWFYTSLTNPTWKSLAALSDGLTVYFHQGAVVGYGGGMPSSDLRSKQGQFGPQPALAANTWHHWAITRTDAGVVNVFANGVAGGLDIGNGAAQTGNTYDSTGTTFRVGVASGGAGENFDGYLDEIRFTPGIARYTGNFTVPTAPFPNG